MAVAAIVSVLVLASILILVIGHQIPMTARRYTIIHGKHLRVQWIDACQKRRAIELLEQFAAERPS